MDKDPSRPESSDMDERPLSVYAAIDAGRQMFLELEAMLKFASGRGLQPAPWISQTAGQARFSYSALDRARDQFRMAEPDNVEDYYVEDEVPVGVPVEVPVEVLEDVARAHRSLAGTIVPATPRSVTAIQLAEDLAQRQIASRRGVRRTFKQIWFSLGLLPIQRQLSVLGLIFLALFIIGLVIPAPT